ncbi:uncharacterized protein LOC128198626 [Bicyclus anynana]|uniref:Uncharacterized protein LOC128198626 n=1 Tax=Bicyclus anynana TaxID=110368 RepID=A0ABM3LP72_BICAN|nr:uncharacterized protein LOC128198626 [Bicyclus anynana]
MHYLTSTPGFSEEAFDEDCSTPYTINFRRASMSPITKSTQKLSKAMQESIMTPRSRKPLIITSEQRDSMPESAETKHDSAKMDMYRSMSPKNDSDFVSSDDDMMSRSSLSCERSVHSGSASLQLKGRLDVQTHSDVSPLRSENTRFVISHDRKYCVDDLNATLCGSDDINLEPKTKQTNMAEQTKSLSEPFKEYLLSRSVLTATPVDLSILNKSDTDYKISDSLMYCLDGNLPTDLTLSISNLAVESCSMSEGVRSPLKNINNVNIEVSPNRKRCAISASVGTDSKKINIEKENVNFQLRETDL